MSRVGVSSANDITSRWHLASAANVCHQRRSGTGMSALAPLATELMRRCYAPLCAMSGHMQCSKSRLLDHLVGTGEQRRRHVEAERSGGLEVDHQLVLARRLHRQVGLAWCP